MSLRVMWLLNHSSARKFEIQMLKRIGVSQIFLPKSYPQDPFFRSANVDFSEDQFLDIPESELKVLNSADWYRGASPDVWHIANKYFDVLFFILHQPEVLLSAAKYFRGAILWRTYGLDKTMSYGKIIKYYNLFRSVREIGSRFYFGEAYSHLADIEPQYLKDRRVYLPLGLGNSRLLNTWEGKERKIYFVCPDIGFNPYYAAIYNEFRSIFADMNYVIAGAQPFEVRDPKVLGYVTNEQHAYNMAQCRVMFYHSQEPYHIHYHPFEAIRAGMPLVFMADGMLDRMGGRGLPGRCNTTAEAKRKIERILADDWRLIEDIRASQSVLLEPMTAEICEPAWRDGFVRIATDLEEWRGQQAARPKVTNRKKVAVILPVAYKGGSLRGAKLVAEAIQIGSQGAGEPVEVVFAHLDKGGDYSTDDFDDLPACIKRRPINLCEINAAEARRAMRYAGHADWEPYAERYLVLEDGINQFMDCDLWLIISDRLLTPILPLRPIAHMVYDYLQRYEPILTRGADQPFIDAVRTAERVFITTEFTRQDALQYGGISPQKLVKLPMLSPRFVPEKVDVAMAEPDYFIWTTNAAPHKNHGNALRALDIYYGEFGGSLRCMITGVDTDFLLSSSLPYLKSLMAGLKSNKRLLSRLTFSGNLLDKDYRRLLAGAAFLWHPGRIDNGTFSVIEAASLGIPALSSDYPAMREIDAQFRLNLMWQQADDARSMANAIWEMERHHVARRENLPTAEELASQDTQRLAGDYWKAIRECL
ncbi:hypothetical protein [Laribacter hongkongensis]|uniref:hypothetical protein n=1 Tax=Laribacter hongkongensis TaxID=168471 RepID=UPI001EFC7D14|nr:hypothetical protein [Laribacter hongkongensis]MCG9082781.1 hypothetical protein [Laribacter hongkongensis]